MHGRAGRENLPGSVVIQTYNPQSFAIQYAKKQDYDLFYKTEIELRRQLKYPPFSDIILVSFSGENEMEVINVSNVFYKLLKVNLPSMELMCLKRFLRRLIKFKISLGGGLLQKV